MAIRVFEITDFTIKLGYRITATFGVTTIKALGLISCIGNDNQRVVVYFLHDESLIPNPAVTSEGKWGNIFLPKEMMPIWIDLLRNQKPLYGYINPDIPKLTNVSTSKDPVGAEDI